MFIHFSKELISLNEKLKIDSDWAKSKLITLENFA